MWASTMERDLAIQINISDFELGSTWGGDLVVGHDAGHGNVVDLREIVLSITLDKFVTFVPTTHIGLVY